MKEYENEKKQLIQGFGTWDTRSLTTHVHMPDGFAVNIAFKEYYQGQYLRQPLVGRQHPGAEVVFVGPHTYDHTYTELSIEWQKMQFRVKTAQVNGDLLMKVEMTANHTRFVPLCVFEGEILWNRGGTVKRDGAELSWKNDEGSSMTLHICKGSIKEDPYCDFSGAYIPVNMETAVYASIGNVYTADEIENILSEKKSEYIKQKEAYGKHAPAWEAMQTCLIWDEVYDPMGDRLTSNVSRIWNVNRGGFGMFCWDNFFAALMISLDDPARGRMNAIEILNETVEAGFVPNCSNAYGRKSFDRSQPPVGSFVCREIFRRENKKWFLEQVYDKLLRWNEWWVEERLCNGLLCWGSNDYDNMWEVTGIHERFGAALESGLDNSPMYDGIPFDAEKNIMCLWDVGLNSMYTMDCECLADIAGILGRNADAEKLNRRAELMRKQMQNLWDDRTGMFLNKLTQTGEFSTVTSPTNFYTALCKVPSAEQYERMIKEHLLNTQEFWGEWVLPSISRKEASYHDNNYWRGRVWPPMNFLVYIGMKRYPDVDNARKMLAEKSEKLLMNEWIEERHVHENYNADTGDGDDVRNSDRFYQWGGLLGYVALAEDGRIPNFGETICKK